MPIPPRPIPASNRPSTSTRMRPGSSVPRKSLQSLEKLDWRSEISLLHDTHSRSLPPSSGVKVVDQIKEQTAKATEGNNGAVEVGIEGLIEEGKGKREKRATTATTLGFDFVSNPTVIALPDATPTAAKPTIAGRVEHRGRASPTLTNTPSTPGLLATRRSPLGRSDSEDDLEDDDDDWEHINALDDTNLREEQLEDDGSQSEEDVIVLGELELEDEFDLADHRRAERHASKTPITGVVPYLGETVKPKRSTSGKGETRGISYAAILGGTVHEGR